MFVQVSASEVRVDVAFPFTRTEIRARPFWDPTFWSTGQAIECRQVSTFSSHHSDRNTTYIPQQHNPT